MSNDISFYIGSPQCDGDLEEGSSSNLSEERKSEGYECSWWV
jgi:hypothetical protein